MYFITHTPIFGLFYVQRQSFFHRNKPGKNYFQASAGWLQKFKRRFGIHQLTVSRKSLLTDLDAVLLFIEKLRNVIQE